MAETAPKRKRERIWFTVPTVKESQPCVCRVRHYIGEAYFHITMSHHVDNPWNYEVHIQLHDFSTFMLFYCVNPEGFPVEHSLKMLNEYISRRVCESLVNDWYWRGVVSENEALSMEYHIMSPIEDCFCF